MLYAVLSIVVLAIGDTVDPTADTSVAKGVVSLSIGILFLLVGAVIAVHHPRTDGGPPHWATMLESARPTGAFMAGVVLAIANPNVFLLLSGLGVVVSEASGRGEEVAGAGFLLGGVALDFVVPVVAFAVLGRRARDGLDRMKGWMVTHDRALTLTILLGFGVLFVGRGLGQVL